MDPDRTEDESKHGDQNDDHYQDQDKLNSDSEVHPPLPPPPPLPLASPHSNPENPLNWPVEYQAPKDFLFTGLRPAYLADYTGQLSFINIGGESFYEVRPIFFLIDYSSAVSYTGLEADHKHWDSWRRLFAWISAMAPADSLLYTAPRPAPVPAPVIAAPEPNVAAPHPSYINVSRMYTFQQQIQNHLIAIGANPTREDTFRIQGVQWINDVRIHLQLPVRTFDTACIYFHKFRLVHKDNEYSYPDAAAAALLTACKIEDTLKKSKEILCAAHNLNKPTDHLSSDDISLEAPSKIVIGLERLMLESSNFDFRNRYPQKHLAKLAREMGLEKNVAQTAYNMMTDLYKTYAPLKATCAAMSFACAELATLVLEKQRFKFREDQTPSYKKWHTSRAEVIETILDLLDLYTHFQRSTIVGPAYAIEKLLQIRLKLNEEIEHDSGIPRFTQQHELKTNGHKLNGKTPKTPVTPASPADFRANGAAGTNGREGASPATLSPRSASSRGRIGPKDGTVRFMLDSAEAKRESAIVDDYYKVEYEEYEIEVDEPIEKKREERGPRPGPRDHRNDRGGYHMNKRGRYRS